MTSFADGVKAFGVKVERVAQDVFVGVVQETHTSIVTGSPLTGAVGQPVDTGALRASWQITFVSPTSAVIATNLVYAPIIEDGIAASGKPIQFKSQVGGAHSVKQTVANFDRIVEAEAAKAGQS
jgi:hypothetical protein